jgi:hypothetical protein
MKIYIHVDNIKTLISQTSIWICRSNPNALQYSIPLYYSVAYQCMHSDVIDLC